tara:strand:+ start:1886 stop:3352 length:1467 start_codon:yes stop_codon:yes gene_type:complete
LNILIRSDSFYKIGSGHIYRSINLINKLISYNFKVTYITNTNIHQLLKIKKNFKYIIDTKLSNTNLLENNKIKNFLKNNIINHIIIDTNQFLFKPSQYIISKKIIITQITDKYKIANINTNIINQNIFELISAKKNYLGSEFSFIRKLNNSKNKKDINKVNSICIFFGTSDTKKLTLRLVRFLTNFSIFQNYKFHIILGKFNKEIEDIQNLIKNHKNFKSYYMVDDINDIYKKSDIAIGNCGLAHTERMLIGLTTILISSNKLQESISASLFKKKISFFIPNDDILFDINLKNHFLKILNNISDINLFKNNCLLSVDNHGIDRFIIREFSSKINIINKIKFAQFSDFHIYYNLFNPLKINGTQFFENKDILKKYKNYFSKYISNDRILILFQNNIPIGQITFNKLKCNIFTISYSIKSYFNNYESILFLVNNGIKNFSKKHNSLSFICHVDFKDNLSIMIFNKLKFYAIITKINKIKVYKFTKKYEKI